MPTLTVTASGSGKLDTVYYGTSTWRSPRGVAYQGAWNSTSGTAQSRVGIIYFSDLELTNRTITSLNFYATTGRTGWNASKTVKIYASLTQGINTSKASSAYYNGTNKLLGTLTENFYDGRTINNVDTELFRNLKEYFESGNTTLVIYNGETSATGGGNDGYWSTNYVGWKEVKLTINYEEGGYVYINTNGTSSGWKKAIPYIYTNGAWRRAIPYVYHGGSWKSTSE